MINGRCFILYFTGGGLVIVLSALIYLFSQPKIEDGFYQGQPIPVFQILKDESSIIKKDILEDKVEICIDEGQTCTIGYSKKILLYQSFFWNDKELTGKIKRPHGLNVQYQMPVTLEKGESFTLMIIPKWKISFRSIFHIKLYDVELYSLKVVLKE